MVVLTAPVVLTSPLMDGVGDEGGEPRVGEARVPFWAGAQVNPNQTAVPASPLHVTSCRRPVTTAYCVTISVLCFPVLPCSLPSRWYPPRTLPLCVDCVTLFQLCFVFCGLLFRSIISIFLALTLRLPWPTSRT